MRMQHQHEIYSENKIFSHLRWYSLSLHQHREPEELNSPTGLKIVRLGDAHGIISKNNVFFCIILKG